MRHKNAAVPINDQIPLSRGTAAQADPPVNDGVSFAHYGDLRICAFGSGHSGGANFALTDGGCTFLADTLSRETLRGLATRSGNEPAATP